MNWDNLSKLLPITHEASFLFLKGAIFFTRGVIMEKSLATSMGAGMSNRNEAI